MKNLKVLAINICLRPYMPLSNFPMGLAYVASAIYRAGYPLEILDLDRNRMSDEELKEVLKRKDFDVVALGCIVTGYKYVKKISQIIREVKKEAAIIAGNSVADSIPQLLLEKTEVDIAVIGEGDLTIVKVLDQLNDSASLKGVKGIWYKENTKIIANPLRPPIADIDSIPSPEWTLFDIKAYIKGAREIGVGKLSPLSPDKINPFILNTARGCPFRCTFCYQVFQHYPYRHRSINSILSEIKNLQDEYGINYFSFYDDLTFYSKRQIEEFADQILAKNLKFFWQGDCRSNLFDSEEDLKILKKVKEAGCVCLGYSLESANEEILKAMNKRLSTEDFIRQKKLLDKAGLITLTSLVLGYPQETKETIKETMDLCYRLDIYPSMGYLLPQPGSPMYGYILKNKVITGEEEYLMSLGDRQDLRINLTKMSDGEFQGEVVKHLKRISDKLGLGLSEENLIKTTTNQGSKKLT